MTWNKEKNQAFYTSKTRYIDNNFLKKNFNLKKEDFYRPERLERQERKIILDKPKNLFWRIYDTVVWITEMIQGIERKKYELGGKPREAFDEPEVFIQSSKFESNKKNVTIKAYNFGWLLRGDYGRDFIKFLAQQKNDSSLFESEAVKAII